jgi:TolB-like protein
VAEGGGEEQTTGAHPATPDVFISYASQDAALADAVVAALEGQGLKCWIAPRDVTPGEFYADAIVGAINAARILVLVLTESAVASPHVLREIERASAKRHPVVSFRIDAASLPPGLEYFLSASHWLDATVLGVDTALPKLAEAVHRLVAPASPTQREHQTGTAQPASDLFPPPPVGTRSSRRRNGPIVALIAIIVLGLAYFAVNKLWLAKHAAGDRPVAAALPMNSRAAPVVSEESVAVLPFADMSEKKDQEYFADGLAEELIDMLTKVQDLHVPARTSSFYFKGKNEKLTTIAKELKVAHVLEGSVRKAGNRLRITAQLVSTDNGFQLWSETYDRDAEDIFKVQDEISAAVVSALKLKLAAGTRGTDSRGTANTEAYNQYLLGRAFHMRYSGDGFRRAIESYKKALELDPGYADAYARLGLSEAYLANSTGNAADLKRAEGDIEKSIGLAPSRSTGYRIRAVVRMLWQWDWAGAQADFEKARALDPGDNAVHQDYAMLLAYRGKVPEAIAETQNALQFEPLSVELLLNLGNYQTAMDDRTGAEASYRRGLDIEPGEQDLVSALSAILLLEGKAPESRALCDKLQEDEVIRLLCVARAEHTLGHAIESQRALDEAIAKGAVSNASDIAEVYAWRGEKDKAFEWMNKAYQRRDMSLAEIKILRSMDSLRGDPRYRALLRKMNLPE